MATSRNCSTITGPSCRASSPGRTTRSSPGFRRSVTFVNSTRTPWSRLLPPARRVVGPRPRHLMSRLTCSGPSGTPSRARSRRRAMTSPCAKSAFRRRWTNSSPTSARSSGCEKPVRSSASPVSTPPTPSRRRSRLRSSSPVPHRTGCLPVRCEAKESSCVYEKTSWPSGRRGWRSHHGWWHIRRPSGGSGATVSRTGRQATSIRCTAGPEPAISLCTRSRIC